MTTAERPPRPSGAATPRSRGAAVPAASRLGRHQARYPARETSVRAARRAVAGVLRDWGLPGTAVTAEQVVSELVSNAVQHSGATTVGVSVTRISPARVRLVVTDTSPVRPHTGAPEEDDEHGRGLLLVGALAVCWGCDRVPGGKRVWAELCLGGEM
ncbi:ATP-binding protein [Streptomyces sp. HNM0574]|uniref:ATP-binding protein n=1 Tax=Streptomyces sp. HNM0574 TaxID=2714954 RepID=UPI00146F4222|nr:ATP-binding protein [Streptomyces sp. HNM0574]NLU68985.1 ATP-binding protein [Streptomyces sp. HNM0574]